MSDGLVQVRLGSKAGNLAGRTLRVDPLRAAKWREIGWLYDESEKKPKQPAKRGTDADADADDSPAAEAKDGEG